MAGLSGKGSVITDDLALGWKQRLALGCAVLPNLPYSSWTTNFGGRPMSRRSFWELIHQMAEQSVTVFVTTHYMEEAEYCNRLGPYGLGKDHRDGDPR